MNIVVKRVAGVSVIVAAVLFLIPLFRESAGAGDLPANRLDTLDMQTEVLYRAASAGNRQAAYQAIQNVEQTLNDPAFEHHGNGEGRSALRASLNEVERVLNYGKSPEQWGYRTAAIKLALDAMLHGENALWLGYEDIMLDDLNRLREGWEQHVSGANLTAEQALERLILHAQLIESAALMQRDPNTAKAAAERIKQVEQMVADDRSGEINPLWVLEVFNETELSIRQLFAQNGAAAVEPYNVPVPGAPSWQWTAFIGSIIMIALGYAGWRRFRYDRDEITYPKG